MCYLYYPFQGSGNIREKETGEKIKARGRDGVMSTGHIVTVRS